MTSLATKLALSALLAALAPAVSAAPVLRGDIVVAAAVVTVGDMFEEAGPAAETGLFRAPAPGTAGMVSLEDIAAAARRAGIAHFESAGLDRVRVARAGTLVDEELVSTLIAADLAARGILTDKMSYQMALDAPLPVLHAASAQAPAALVMLRYMPGSSTFSARFQIAGRESPLDVSGQIQMMIEAPHLVRSLPAGAILAAEDVDWRPVPLAYAETAGLVGIEDLVGKQLQRPTRAGVLLRPADLKAPELVSRNDTVTVIYRNGPLTLTIRGQALNAASLHQPVNVLNLMSRRTLRGVAIAPGTIAVDAGAQQIAGL